jgi:hypothetical protein
MSPSNRFVGFYQWNTKNEIRDVTVFLPWESRTIVKSPSITGKGEWQGIRGKSLVASLQYGFWNFKPHYSSSDPGVPSWIDLTTQYRGGENTNFGNYPDEHNRHTSGKVSWYRPDWFGNHDMKIGFDYLARLISRAWYSRGTSGNYQLQFKSGVPSQIAIFNYPAKPITLTRYLGTYVSDSWTIARRLTLNLGVRYAHDRGLIPAQCRQDAEPVAFGAAQCYSKVDFRVLNTISPRLAVAYDIQGNGKTVIKGGWGRFTHMRLVAELVPVNQNVGTTTLYRWRDLNGNRDYDAGEVNLDRNSNDFINSTTTDSGLFSNGVPNPNEKAPKVDEFNASIERELIPNFAIRATGIYSRSFDVYRILNTLRPYGAYNVTINVQDPGPDGVVGTADDPGKVLTYYDYPATLAGVAYQVPTLINDPNSTSKYTSFELAATKRFSNNWQVMASHSATKLDVPFYSGNNTTPVNFNPTAEINMSNRTWEWLTRISGVYRFPYDISMSGNFSYEKGTAQARQVRVTAPQSGTLTLNAESIGSIQLPNLVLLDYRLEKSIMLAAGHKVAVRVNLYNVLNKNTVMSRSVLSSASYLKPTAILPPRILEFGVSFDF